MDLIGVVGAACGGGAAAAARDFFRIPHKRELSRSHCRREISEPPSPTLQRRVAAWRNNHNGLSQVVPFATLSASFETAPSLCQTIYPVIARCDYEIPPKRRQTVMTAPTNRGVTAWYFLVGLSFGHLLTSRDAFPHALDAWKSVVNTLLVPLYSISVFVYLLSRIWLRFLLASKRRKVVIPKVAPPPIEQEEGKVNMNGAFKLVKNDNFDGFLAAQGIPWALRRAADRARPTHRFSHVGDTITIKITGIIESETTYEIGGPPMGTSIRGRVFEDVISYLETNDGIKSEKKALTEDYDIVVLRQLAPDRMSLTMTSKAIFHDDREDVVAIQVFERVE